MKLRTIVLNLVKEIREKILIFIDEIEEQKITREIRNERGQPRSKETIEKTNQLIEKAEKRVKAMTPEEIQLFIKKANEKL